MICCNIMVEISVWAWENVLVTKTVKLTKGFPPLTSKIQPSKKFLDVTSKVITSRFYTTLYTFYLHEVIGSSKNMIFSQFI